jgi:hypothetical protein
MGTRSTTTVYDGDKPLVSIYRQFDGYPSGHGQALAAFLANKELVNGFGGGDTAMQFNGAGDLAMRLVTALKEGNADAIGNFYVIPHEGAGGEDYHYDIIVGPAGSVPHVKVKCYGKPLAEGSVSEFVALAEAAEMGDDED